MQLLLSVLQKFIHLFPRLVTMLCEKGRMNSKRFQSLSTWISPRMGCKVLEHLFQEGHCAFRRTAVGIGRVDLKSVSGFHCDGRGKEAPIFQKSFLEGPATDPQRLRAADPNALPGWWSRTVHERHGTTVGCLEEGKVIYVCSWYLHGTRARRSQHFSILCLDQN